MVFPLGEWLLLSIGFLAWAEWPLFRIDRSLRIIPLVWVLGWIVEYSFTFFPPWDWHFPRIFVLVALTLVAWKKTEERKYPGILLASFCIVAQDLFVLNEPGILAYDQWLFAIIFVSVAFFITRDLWSMIAALCGGMLLSIVFTIFLFDGVVRYYTIPNAFLWHFSIGACMIIAVLRKAREYYQARKTLIPIAVHQESQSDEGIAYRKDD
ncbi:hypothetical protein [Desulfitobacterium sp. PCE1]|uniref:Uncharacterized protein n=1 Tax=Desulfitobacterium dehalogenans (strain ATCC 51507 / DSM 9161 / JW/IU-DC1) TaxID=756499 RepID=I4AAZ8_DESDJ|nr:hypothetical protein [Desulfitobacterium sp. PCE1]AFM01133.1 hypothetical protein Desde_2829 [Desulfitobacterium dehalogenans ATCC 51507]